MEYPRGSEWRKWDYHVHTPFSWYYKYRAADALDKIASAINDSDCAAFGINDYLTIDGYLALQSKVKKPIFPVIEFRMTDILVEKKSGAPHFNFHLFFTNEEKYLQEIKSFLGALQFKDFENKAKSLTPADIEAFGKQVLPGESDRDKLRDAALEKIKFPFQDVIRLLEERKLRDHCLVIMPYDEHGGIDKVDPTADGLQKSGLIRQADMIGSSSPKVRDYFLGKTTDRYTPEQFALWVGRPKPILKGSDAHEPEAIGHLPRKADQAQLHCWIKADPTFEGLKQTIYEPEERIFVGSTAPDTKDDSKVIESISVRGATDWFEDQTIPLNRDLVCIIGGKGSGKTALVDLVGMAAGDLDVDNPSFLTKANRELASTKVLLQWADGTTETELEIADPLSIPETRKARYLSQSFVESLCSFNRHEQLEREIESILFQYIPGTQRLGAESFESLKLKKTEGIQLEINRLGVRLRELNDDTFNLGKLIESKAQLVKERDQLEKDIAELHKQKPQPSTEEERKVADELRRLTEQRAKAAAAIQQLRIKQTRLEVLKKKFGLISESVEAFNLDAKTALNELGEPDLIAQIKISLPERTRQILDERIQALVDQAGSLEGTRGASVEGQETLKAIDEKIESLNQKSSAEVQKKNKLQEFNRRIAEHVQKRDALTERITAIEQTSRKELDSRFQERKTTFLAFFRKLEEKRQVLEQLYNPLNAKAAATEEGAKVQFYARYNFDAAKFGEDANAVFDQRKSVVRGEQAFVDAGKKFWVQLCAALPAPDIKILESFVESLKKREGATREIREQLRPSKTTKDYNNWLFSLDYYDVEYGIKYEGTDLDKLSPGKKGVVLLLIYLTIDKDYRPLIIDQPEENLDNRSVYSTLVEYFRRAKHNRQVIIVTHNANLVVNGDAEQVIVANFEKDRSTQKTQIRYVSGALENTTPAPGTGANVLDRQGIREHVCELLEGGETAFGRRERKYGFPKS